MLFLVEKYREAHPEVGPEVAPDLVSEWAILRGMWEHKPRAPREVLRHHISSPDYS